MHLCNFCLLHYCYYSNLFD
uniref:Uncharacterized protein n=1 Tax=Rhizophora mucronata TaxID=61149 RepID=A0A2P2NEK0_RHIMU